MSSGEPLIGKQGLVTVGFVSHHVEALPFIRKQMERHETLVLEEPSAPSFPGMEKLFNTIRLLKRDLASQTVEDYVASKTEMT